jgi:hypothetical protein
MPVFALVLTILAVAVLALLGIGALRLRRRASAREDRRGWRVRLATPGRWAYEERREGVWEGIPFEEIAEVNENRYVVFAPSVETWRTFPAWVQGRRMEILGRVRSELTIRRYVIEGIDAGETEAVPPLAGGERIPEGRP